MRELISIVLCSGFIFLSAILLNRDLIRMIRRLQNENHDLRAKYHDEWAKRIDAEILIEELEKVVGKELRKRGL